MPRLLLFSRTSSFCSSLLSSFSSRNSSRSGVLSRASAVLLCLALTACGSSTPSVPRAMRPDSDAELPRAHPGYVQWLEKQSILRQSEELISVVSGTPLVWGASGSVRDIRPLLNAADVWLDFDPAHAALGEAGESALAALPGALPPRLLAALGIRGIFLSSVTENAGGWNLASGSNGLSFESEAVIGLRFASMAAAKDASDVPSADYVRLDEACAKEGVILGGEILPASTGMGPDFRLARMGLSRYADLYMMVEAPRAVWSLLPPAPDPGATAQTATETTAGTEAGSPVNETGNVPDEVVPLSPASVAELARRGILPPPFSRDTLQTPTRTLPPGGWAATAPLTGTDGVTRRWIYRYAETPRILPLNWDAPRGSARRAFSASIIRQAGLLHQPLLRVSVAELAGLEPASPEGFSPEPALSALTALSRDIRRYGGWSLLGDFIPPALLAEAQRRGIDFVSDSITSPALEYALLTGDTGPLRRNLDMSLSAGVEHARLWRSTPTHPLPLAAKWLPLGPGASLRAELAKASPAWTGRILRLSASDTTLLATAPTLAAVATGLSPEDILRTDGSAQEGWQRALRDAHLLQIAFRAFLPGLLSVSGYDLAGAVQSGPGLNSSTGSSLPLAWGTDGRPGFSPAGLPARAAYTSLALQHRLPESFAARLEQITRIRKESGIARGVLLGRAKTGAEADAGQEADATVACVSRLPDASLLLVAGNFSPRSYVTNVILPESASSTRATDLVSGAGAAVSGRNLRLQMGAWGFRAIHLFPSSSSR